MTMTAPERAAYDAWMESKNHRTAGSALLNAFLDGYRARGAEHIEACRYGCVECLDERLFGTCRSCGAETEAVGPHEYSRCCGSPVTLNPHDRPLSDERARIVQDAATRSAGITDREDAWSAS